MIAALRAILFILAVALPGGLVVYFLYGAYKHRQRCQLKAIKGSSLSIIPVIPVNGKAPENSP